MSASKLLPGKRSAYGRRSYYRALAAPVVAGMLFLTACGKADTAANVNPSESGAPTSTSYFSPLDEYMNPTAGPELDQAAYQARDRQVQELVATCMKDQGFDYIPQDNSSTSYAPPYEEGLAERDIIAKYGYWVTTQLDMQPGPSEMPVDPNQAAYEAMSDGERMAYDQALWGTGAMTMAIASSAAGSAAQPQASTTASSSAATSTDAVTGAVTDTATGTAIEAGATDPAVSPEAGSPVSIDQPQVNSESYVTPTTPEEKGCYGVAQEKIYGDQMNDGSINYEDFQDLFDAQNELFMSIEKDPRLDAAVTAWSVCLEGKGYPGFTEMQAPMIDVNKQWAELNNQEFTVTPDGGWSTGPKPGTENDPPVEPDAAKVAELRKYEIDLALADYDCKGDYQKLYDEVRISLQEQFVQDHLPELERFRDAVNSGGN